MYPLYEEESWLVGVALWVGDEIGGEERTILHVGGRMRFRPGLAGLEERGQDWD